MEIQEAIDKLIEHCSQLEPEDPAVEAFECMIAAIQRMRNVFEAHLTSWPPVGTEKVINMRFLMQVGHEAESFIRDERVIRLTHLPVESEPNLGEIYLIDSNGRAAPRVYKQHVGAMREGPLTCPGCGGAGIVVDMSTGAPLRFNCPTCSDGRPA